MAFRRDGGEANEWKRWRAKHRDALTRAGIPDDLLADKLRWLVFLESGGWDAESGFKVDMLSRNQAAELHALLVREYGEGLSGGCIQILARLISN
jgi:hypothetical protein